VLYNPHTTQVPRYIRISWCVGLFSICVGSIAILTMNADKLRVPDCSALWGALSSL
jgi:hypothetical protein